MTNSDPDSQHEIEPRQRLLDAATELFAERAFKEVSIREICEKAGGANVASVNYYFRDKAGLYRELLESMLARWEAERERHAKLVEGKTPEEKLYLYVRWFIGNILEERADERDMLFGRILNREMADPSPDFILIVQKGMVPNWMRLMTIVAEVAGLAEGSQAVLLCTHSTMGQCLMYGSARRLSKYFGPPEMQFTPEIIDGIARQVTQFSLAGIRAIAQSTRELGAAGKAGSGCSGTPPEE
ncbi:MAG TPA: CerR family C-terminal domain-containing protein [Terriglobia bacterium]|nr:CerR family C-terminal domain-containing protein [Terriglobia bacterium]